MVSARYFVQIALILPQNVILGCPQAADRGNIPPDTDSNAEYSDQELMNARQRLIPRPRRVDKWLSLITKC